MSCFSIPYALDTNDQLISPANAIKGGIYRCPSCLETVLIRKGNIRVHHYSHKASNNCNYNNAIHKTAIQILADQLKKNIESISPILSVERKCLTCNTTNLQPIPKTYQDVIPEYRIDQENIVDIALLQDNKIKAFFEIKVTHKSDIIKRISLGIPFIEVEGTQILNNVSTLYPIEDYFKQYYCIKCITKNKIYENELNEYCNKHNIELPKFFYRYVLSQCTHCRKKIILYFWPENGKLLEPIPRTITNLKLTKYYVNTCIYCNKIQKNSDLVDSPYGIFHNFTISDNFERDLSLLKLKVFRTMKT